MGNTKYFHTQFLLNYECRIYRTHDRGSYAAAADIPPGSF